MAFNLANERIQDTYEQLVQISGSTLLNGIGTAIPAITNINSVSSSYAITASYAQYAVSASHEIVHELSSSYADTASFANFATSAGTATTASYINPTFISASAAASGFGGGGSSFPYTGSAVISGSLKTTGSLFIYNYYDDGFIGGTSSVFEVNTQGPGLGKQTAIKVSNRDSQFNSPLVDMTAAEVGVNSLSLPGNGTISFSGSSNSYSIQSSGENLTIRAKDVLTLQAQRTTGTIRLFGGAYAVLTGTQTSLNLGSTTEPGPTPQITITSSGHHTFRFGASGSFTGSFSGNLTGTASFATTASYINPTFISASAAASGFGGGGGATPTLQQVTTVGNVTNLSITASAFSGNGSGLTNINTAFGAELYYNAADYVIDLPGDFNDPAVTVSISQSGVYLISSSKVPPYGTNGPRVNLQWCPQQLGSGVAKVKFFIPSLDTGNGVSYKSSVSCSADYQYIWNSTVTPSGSTTTTLARSLTLPQYSNGTGVTVMIKGEDGYVYFATTSTPVPSQGYIYTGPSLGLLV
jgi:hypothetical protein